MTEQPTALRLADLMGNNGNDCTCYAYSYAECACGANWAEKHIIEAATELRRLHGAYEALCNDYSGALETMDELSANATKLEAINAQLLDVLNHILAADDEDLVAVHGAQVTNKTRAAIAAAKGEA
jgi:hypothetical protein